MRCIQLDFPVSSLNGYEFAYKIRAGYILSNMLNVAGASTFYITYSFIVKSLASLNKARFIYGSKMCNDEEVIEIIESFFQDYKEFKSIKHPPTQYFHAFKKLERELERVLDEWSDSFKARLAYHGYDGLLKLINDDYFVVSHCDDLSVIEDMKNLSVTDLLTNVTTIPNTNNAVFLMPEKFYHENYFETLVAESIEEIEPDLPYFIKCFNLPNLNMLLSNELISAREHLAELLKPFKSEVEKWAISCYESNGNELFINKVLPTMASVQKSIDESPIFVHLKSTLTGCISAPIYMGEVSPLIVWKYYFEMKLLKEDEYNELVNEYNSILNYTIPVMLFTAPNVGLKLMMNSDLKEVELSEEAVINRTKKYLDID